LTKTRFLIQKFGLNIRTIFHDLFTYTDETFQYAGLIVFAITLIGGVLRLYEIDRPVGYDEAYTFINFSSKHIKYILADYHAPNNHILNSLLIGIAYWVLGPHNWIVRVPAFLAGTLSIPVAYLVTRRFFSFSVAIAASSAIAITNSFIFESINGRGYPLIIFFSLILCNLAWLIINNPNKIVYIAYAIIAALGFYTIPIFLYPLAGISLWVVVTQLLIYKSPSMKWLNVKNFLISCFSFALLSFILYSPVIFFGTGLKSLIANDYVSSQTWEIFKQNLFTRLTLTWNNWYPNKETYFGIPVLIGFLISLIFYKSASKQKLPLQIFLVLGPLIMLVIQKVAPLPRIWGYLEAFYIIFSTSGLVWILKLFLKPLTNEQYAERSISILVLGILVTVFIVRSSDRFSPQAIADRTIAPEQVAAEYIATHITQSDTLIAPAPVDLQTAYYLKILGVNYDIFYQRDHPVVITNALAIIRTRTTGKIKSLDDLISAFKLQSKLNTDAGKVVFEYGPLKIYSIPAY